MTFRLVNVSDQDKIAPQLQTRYKILKTRSVVENKMRQLRALNTLCDTQRHINHIPTLRNFDILWAYSGITIVFKMNVLCSVIHLTLQILPISCLCLPANVFH